MPHRRVERRSGMKPNISSSMCRVCEGGSKPRLLAVRHNVRGIFSICSMNIQIRS